MSKKHHMTKHQYEAYNKKQRRRNHSFEVEQEEGRHAQSNNDKYRNRRDEKVKRLLRNTQGNSGEIPDEEYDEYNNPV